MSVESITKEIREEIARLTQALGLLEGGAKQRTLVKQAKAPGRHTMSAAARKRISLAQKARWKKVREGKK